MKLLNSYSLKNNIRSTTYIGNTFCVLLPLITHQRCARFGKGPSPSTLGFSFCLGTIGDVCLLDGVCLFFFEVAMLNAHYSLIDRADLAGANRNKLYKLPNEETGGRDIYVWWDSNNAITCLTLEFWRIRGIQNEEQVWKVIDAFLHYMGQPGYPSSYDFIKTHFRKNSRFYKNTFGDIKVTAKQPS